MCLQKNDETGTAVCSKQSTSDTVSSWGVEVSSLAEVSVFEGESLRMEMSSPNNPILVQFI
jgi:hypothetical protein